MAFTWEDWLRFVLIPLVVAGVAAIVATRNAKKTPHERLKNLVDIHKNMPDALDGRKVVESAIARELVDFDRRLAADQRGFWAGVKERLAQVQRSSVVYVVVGGIVVAVTTALFTSAQLGSEVGLWGSILAGLLAIGAAIGSVSIARQERESLNRDRAAAEIRAHFSRVFMQDISSQDGYDLRENHSYYYSAFDRLVDMGVFERADVDGPDGGGFVRFVLTPEGRKALDAALAEAEAQNAAKWTDIANENDEGDDGPGRGASGA